MIEYTALRSLVSGHTAGQIYYLDFSFTEAKRSRRVDKSVLRAVSGKRIETLYHSADTLWDVTYEPLRGTSLSQLIEFLDSTAGGETFRVWLYGTETTPLTVVREDKGYSMEPFMRVGARALDAFTARMTVREV